MGTHDVIEASFGAEAERGGASCIEILRPARHDAGDDRIGLATDQLDGFGATEPFQPWSEAVAEG